MKMTKTALTRAPKAKLVDELLSKEHLLQQTEDHLRQITAEKIDLEVTVRNIMAHLYVIEIVSY